MQSFFDAADDLVDTEFAKGSKRWLPALRDSSAFAYAYGLRRRELAMLEYVNFGPEPVNRPSGLGMSPQNRHLDLTSR